MTPRIPRCPEDRVPTHHYPSARQHQGHRAFGFLACALAAFGVPFANANTAPTVATDKNAVEVNHSTPAFNSGTFADADGNSVALTASVGTVTQSTVWAHLATYTQGPGSIELDLDSQENLYVVNEGQNRLFKYAPDGTLLTSWSVPGNPCGVAVDSANGVLYVALKAGQRVQKYTLNGAFLTQWGSAGIGNSQFSQPHCVAIDAAGNVYVADSFNAAVKVFTPNGTFLRRWGSGGSGDGQFNFLQGIRITAGGVVYVADRNNHRVQYFTTNGAFLGKFGTAGSGNGQFSSPAGIGIDPGGNIVVGDLGNNRIQKFTPAGVYLDKLGPATQAGNFSAPHGTAFPPSSRAVYVADWANGRVVKFATPGGWNWSYTPPAGPGSVSAVTITATDSGSPAMTSSSTFTLKVIGNPLANAGTDQSAAEGAQVTLDGTQSQDTNTPAKGLTYAWTQVGGPAVNLAGSNSVTPSFTAPTVPAAGATLQFKLVVKNGPFEAADTVTVSVVNLNSPPIANAGLDQTVPENTSVTLSGSGTDGDGDNLTLTWTQIAGPAVVLSGADTQNPQFTTPSVSSEQGSVQLRFGLAVNDGQITSGIDEVVVTVFNTNAAPIANAGPDQTVNETDLVVLDATASNDPDGDSLTYQWAQIAGSPVVSLTSANTANASFSAPEVSIGGATLTFRVLVNDGELSSEATVNVRISNVNHVPLADAGLDQTVPENTQATLNGSNSADIDGDALTYSWVQTGGPDVGISPAGAIVSFITPDVDSTGAMLTFQLTVDDGYGGEATDEMIVTVAYINRPPTVDAGVDQTVNEGENVSLSASASDPDNNALTYAWNQISGPAVVLSDANTEAPSFAAPSVTRAGASIVLRATAQDGFGGAGEDEITVSIGNVNREPSAQAPANLTVAEGTEVTLVGQGTDPDTEEQSELTYAWQQISPVLGPVTHGSVISFTAPLVTAGGDPEATETLGFRLSVIDPNAAASTDDVQVVVTNVAHAPNAIAGGHLTVNEASSVTLNGSASSDPDGDALTFAWVQTAGPVVVLSDANTPYPHFTAPFVGAAGGTLKFELTVADGYGEISSDTAIVTVANLNDPPTVNAAAPSIASLWPPDHRMVQVSIEGIFDPNNNATITITGVTQDEPTNGQGDGDTAIDSIIQSDGTVLVRSERSGKGNGRVYRISFTASDIEGSASGVVKVSVPKSKKTEAAVDSGGSFDSTH